MGLKNPQFEPISELGVDLGSQRADFAKIETLTLMQCIIYTVYEAYLLKSINPIRTRFGQIQGDFEKLSWLTAVVLD